MRPLFFILLFFVLLMNCNAQFMGGNSDGFYILSAPASTFTSQAIYCNGSNGDGFSTGVLLSSPLSNQIAYCSGGNSDGFSTVLLPSITQNTQALYCMGGTADGFSSGTFSGPSYTPSLFCSGGAADGFSYGANPAKLNLNSQNVYCSGGNADGFSFSNVSSLTMNSQNLYCLGGNADGFHKSDYSGNFFTTWLFCMGGAGDGFNKSDITSSLNTQAFYCSGGNADGFTVLELLGYSLGSGIWKGALSTVWTTAGNWVNNTVPDQTVNVVIPSGCLYYPSLGGTLSINSATGAYKTKNLDILDGGSIRNTGSLSVYGNLNVAGSYVATNSSSNAQQVNSGGNLTISPTGSVRLGNQSSGSGFSDLVVNSNGSLNVNGGILEIDDQLNVKTGAAFNMTGGTVFAHKFGLGSSYASAYPGSFYIQSGATGNISGGTVKVAGKATVSNSYVSVGINSSSFNFTGNSSLEFTDGVTTSSDEVELRAVAGANLNNLLVNKPGQTVTIGSNATFSGDIMINPACTLKVKPGMTVTVNGDFNIQH